ncbi:SH3 domain-containing protein [Labrenzia sp. R4_1]|uniref:SH3 domain-containing protein n=1 Tax=Labrenzia sp. R4_1 TaxID=2821106 RepID=UPI001AD9556D|nr:SH3 domain-containing protein [Labrenzia sp. R4_1]MBO9426314.1 SH3 domain-containing protein [Labrenzia sp. R4_1]
MVKVTAQTNSCEPQSEGTPDNATQETQDTNTTTTTANAATEDNQNDPSALAARILQLSADFETKMPQRPKQPALKGSDETPLDIPEVLTAVPMDDWTPRPRRRRVSRALPVQYGPSFKALAVSTVLLALAGTGAIALGLPDLMVGSDPDVVQVKTQTITTVSKGDLTNSVSNTPSSGASPETSKTFTKAQDRIHQAFAETETNANTSTSELANRAMASLDQATTAHAFEPHALQETTRQVSASSSLETSRPFPVTTEPRQAAGTPLAPSVSSDDTKGTITASVNLRATGTKNGTIIGIVPEGSEVSFNDCGKWWCEVVHDGKTGFVGQKFVDR